MPWSHISNGTVVFAKEASISAVWGTHLTGDIGILPVALQHTTASTPVPSGFTLLDDYEDGTGALISVFGKIALSGSEANVTVDITSGDTDDVQAGAIAVFRGGTLTLDATSAVHTESGGGDTNVPYGAYTPAINNTLVLIATGTGDADANNLTNLPSGFAQAFYEDTTLGFDVGVGLQWLIQTTVAAISSGNMTADGNTPSNTTIFALEESVGGVFLPFFASKSNTLLRM